MPATVTVTSFGYLHGEPPAAHLTVDLRHRDIGLPVVDR